MRLSQSDGGLIVLFEVMAILRWSTSTLSTARPPQMCTHALARARACARALSDKKNRGRARSRVVANDKNVARISACWAVIRGGWGWYTHTHGIRNKRATVKTTGSSQEGRNALNLVRSKLQQKHVHVPPALGAFLQYKAHREEGGILPSHHGHVDTAPGSVAEPEACCSTHTRTICEGTTQSVVG